MSIWNARRLLVLLCVLIMPTVPHACAERMRELSTSAEVRALSPDESAKAFPVRIRGVVTYHEPSQFLTFVQDPTGGIYVSTVDQNVAAGDIVEVTGVSGPGMIGRIIEGADHGRASLRVLGKGELPPPIHADLGGMRRPTQEAQWMSVAATVVSVRLAGTRALLTLRSGTAAGAAVLPGYYERDRVPAHLEGLNVEIRGVLGMRSDPGRDTQMVLYVPGLQAIAIDPSDLAERFRIQIPTYADMIGFNQMQSQTVRVRGRVTLLDPGRGLFLDLNDPTSWKSTIWVQSAQPCRLHVGSVVEAVGRLDVAVWELTLCDALLRPTEEAGRPEPVTMDAATLADVDCHGKLVKIEAKLLESHAAPEEDVWVVSAGRSMALAKLPVHAGRLPHWESGSRVSLTGIALTRRAPGFDLPPRPFSYQLWLRTAQDVALLEAPSPWTAQRIRWLLSAVALVVAAALGWNAMLRRKVRAQTETIRQHVAQEAIHRERARIARDLHDEIGSGLGSVTLLSQMAQEEPLLKDAARQEFSEIHRIARATFDSLRDIVWLTSRPALTPTALEQRFHEVARGLLANTPHDVTIQLKQLPNELPLDFVRHVTLFFKEALHNAARHSGANRIRVEARGDSDGVRLMVEDDGCGFDPEGAFEGSGLQGLRDRAESIGGALQIQSRPGEGARIILTAPLPSYEQTGS